MEDINEMRLIRREKLQNLIESGKNPYVHEKFEGRIQSQEIKDGYSEYEGKTVRIAGRIMSKRGHGKVNFMDIQDMSGRIQTFNKLDNFSEEEYEDIKNLDIGDIIGVEGEVFTTKTGEVSVRSKTVTLLGKSLQILPEKFYGLKDMDLKYRQRYVDLIMNPEIKSVFILKSKIISIPFHLPAILLCLHHPANRCVKNFCVQT